MKHTTKLLTLAATLVAVIGLTGCPGPVNNYSDTHEHIWEEVTSEYVAPTCTSKGSKTYKCKVSGCDETKIEEIDALGHSWSVVEDTKCKCIKHYTCTRCGATKTETHHHEDYETSGYCETCEKYKYENNKFTITFYNKVAWNSLKKKSVSTNNEESICETYHFSFELGNITVEDLMKVSKYSNSKVLAYVTDNGDARTIGTLGSLKDELKEKNIIAIIIE